VAVAVAFDDAENLTLNSALFRFWIYEIAYGSKIVGESRERNIGPDRAANCGFNLFRWGHSCSVRFPEFLFYGILARVFESRNDWGEKDNRPICTGSASEGWNWALRGKRLEDALTTGVSSLTRACRMNTWVELRKGKAASSRRTPKRTSRGGRNSGALLRKTKNWQLLHVVRRELGEGVGGGLFEPGKAAAEDEADLSVGPLRCLAT